MKVLLRNIREFGGAGVSMLQYLNGSVCGAKGIWIIRWFVKVLQEVGRGVL